MNHDQPLIHIVDDDASVRKSVGRLLKSRGFRSREFASGRQLLDDPGRSEASCFVVDVHMPKMSGYELARGLLESGSSTPVIFITAHPNEEDRWEQEDSSAVALLVKPFSDSDLYDAIQLALARNFGS